MTPSELPEPPLRPAWLRALVLSGLALTMSTYAWWPAIHAYPATSSGDGQYFTRLIDTGKVSIQRYHELPLWNAYECGGVPLWDNPQVPDASPWMLLMTPLTATATIIAWYILHSAVGFLGMWLFARHEAKVSRAAAFAGAAIFAFCVAHGSQYSGGHAALVTFLYAPLTLLLWRRAETSRKCAVGLGLVLASMFYDGGVYPVPHTCLILAAETLTRVWPRARLRRIVSAAGIMLLVFFTVGAARLLPVGDQILHHKRILADEHDFVTWQTLKDMYLDRAHSWHVEGQEYVWGEYIAYLGGTCLVLMALGLLTTSLEEVWMIAVAAFVFALMMGHFAKFAPWSILKHHIFPFKSMRVPVRFRLILMAFMATWLAFAIDRVPRFVLRVSSRFGTPDGGKNGALAAAARVAILGIALIGVGDAISVSTDVIASKFVSSPESRPPPSVRLYYGGPGQAAYIDHPHQNRGRLDCWEEWNFTGGAPLWQGDVPQARAASDDASVEVANRTQNTFTVDVDVRREGARVLVNGAWDRGWRTDLGTIVEVNKQIALDLPAGRHRVHLWYWPVGLTLGFVLTALGLAGVLLFFTQDRWMPRARRWLSSRRAPAA